MTEPPDRGLWSRIKKARLFRVLALYAGASWVVLQVVGLFIDTTGLPEWTFPGAVVLLLVGLVVILATAWVQAHPLIEVREEAREVPGTWEMALDDLGRAVSRKELPHLTWARSLAAGAVIFLLFFGFAGLYVVIQDRGESFAPAEARAAVAGPGLAVLPFSVRGEELREWREGMVDLLSMGLDGAGGLRAVDSRTVLARWDEVVGDRRADHEQSLAVARATGARWAVLGTAVGIGSDVRLVADVFAVEDGAKIGQAQVEGSPEEMHALVDRLAFEVLDVLVEGDAADLPRVELAAVTTRSVPALKAFLAGEVHLRESDFPAAIEDDRGAIEEDTLFAYAHLRLAEALGWDDRSGAAGRHRQRAVELADRLPERQRFLARADARLRREASAAAVDSLRAATERYPDDPQAWYLLGEAYFHFNPAARPPASLDEARRPFERAAELDPGFGPYRIHLVELLLRDPAPDSARTAEALALLTEHSRDSRLVSAAKLAFRLALGDSVTRAAAFAALDTVDLEVLGTAASRLENPAFADARLEALRHLLARVEPERGSQTRIGFFGTLLPQRGLLDTAFAVLEPLEEPPADVPCVLMTLEVAYRAPLPDAVVREQLTPRAADERAPPNVSLCKALHAARTGRSERLETARAAFRRASGLEGATLDSAQREQGTFLLALIDAFSTWGREGGAAVLPEWEGLFGGQRPSGVPPAFHGALYREAGRSEEALEYYLGEWSDALAYREVGLLLAEAGRTERARTYLRAFVDAWAGADPAFQPLVEEARGMLDSL